MVNSKIIAAVLIVAIIGGGAGVYLFLASPQPVYSAPVTLSGLLVTQRYNFTIAFPNTQMQVSIEITGNTGLYAAAILNATDGLVHDFGILPGSGIEITTWLPAVGSYSVYFAGVAGDFTGTITVSARGPPYAV